MNKKIILFLFFILIASFCFAEVDFDGTDDKLTITDHADFNGTATTTFACWLYLDAYPAVGDSYLAQLFSDEDQTTKSMIWRIGSKAIVANRDNVGINFHDGSNNDDQDDNTNLSLATWTHIAVTTDGSNAKYYINGDISDTNSYSITANSVAKNWAIGSKPYAETQDLDGKITELYVWIGTALSAAEIEMLGKSRVKGVGLGLSVMPTLYLPMDDQPDGTSGDGDTFVDRSGNGHNATGNDGSGNTGLTCYGESFLSYPPNE